MKNLVDKHGHEHVMMREDFLHPAYVLFVTPPFAKDSWLDSIKLKIQQPTGMIFAADTMGVADVHDPELRHRLHGMLTWRITNQTDKIVLQDLNYGYISIVGEMLLLWFDTKEEAENAEKKYG